MFELLFLGSISDYQCNKFYLPENTEICIELSQQLSHGEQMIFLLFQYLPIEPLQWSFDRINVTIHKDDKYQKVCKYLNAIFEYQQTKTLDNYDIRKILEQKPLSSKICSSALNKYLSTSLK